MGQLEDILKHQNMVRNNIMKSFGPETSEDSLEKSFEDEVNPFEMEAYKSELTKAELDEFEKAKHQDGDMHPNGKWVWRQSANGGKGDWRVAKPSRGGGSKATASAAKTGNNNTSAAQYRVNNFMEALRSVNSKYTDKNKVTVVKTDKGNWDTYYDGKRVGTINSSLLSEKSAKEIGWLKKEGRKDDKSTYASKEADAYDKGDGKVGNYPVPTHTSYPAANLYSRLKNNRHFGFKYGLPEEEIMKKLKDYKGNVKVSYHNNAGTSEIYRIKFL